MTNKILKFKDKTYKRIILSKNNLSKLFKSGQKIDGFLVGSNVNTFHYFNGWHLAYSFESNNLQDFQNKLNSFLFYLENELGKYAKFYVQIN